MVVITVAPRDAYGGQAEAVVFKGERRGEQYFTVASLLECGDVEVHRHE